MVAILSPFRMVFMFLADPGRINLIPPRVMKKERNKKIITAEELQLDALTELAYVWCLGAWDKGWI